MRRLVTEGIGPHVPGRVYAAGCVDDDLRELRDPVPLVDGDGR
jgi:hypothetical protein